MHKIKFSITGVKSYTKDKDLNHYLLSFESRDVVLRLEPDNDYDPQAVEVLKDGKTIGHVRKHDLKNGLYYIVSHSDRGCCTATICGVSAQYPSFDAELTYCGEMPDKEFLNNRFGTWAHGWHSLEPVEEWVKLRKCMDSMLTLLKDGKANAATMKESVDTFCKLAVYGFSSEFFDDRDKLQNMLHNSHDEDLREYERQIAKLSPTFHDEKERYNAFCKIMKSLKMQLKADIASFDLTVKEAERQLTKFPDNLFYFEKNKPKLLPSRLYYAQVPFETMLAFLSGTAFVRFSESNSKTYEKKKRKKKLGRPKGMALGKDALMTFYNGDEKTRLFWFDYFKELIKGKRNEDAAKVMAAAKKEGVIDDAPYKETKASYGDIGNRNGYNDGLRKFGKEENEKELDYYRGCIIKKKKELLG